MTELTPLMNWRHPTYNIPFQTHNPQQQLAILWSENKRLNEKICRLTDEMTNLTRQKNELIAIHNALKDKISQKAHGNPQKIFNKQQADLDSLLVMIKPLSLKLLMGIRCFLGSTAFRPHGDPILKSMTLLVNYPIQIYIQRSEKETVTEKLKQEGVIFQRSLNINFVAKKQVSISTGVLINVLTKCKLKYVRVVAHDLKDPCFEEYLTNIDVIPHQTNRFDFGLFEQASYKIFQKQHADDQIFPLFYDDNWEEQTKYRLGSLRNGNKKAYPAIIHNLKRMGTISFNPKNMTRKVLVRSLNELNTVIENVFETKMRYQISYFSNQIQDTRKIMVDGVHRLKLWEKQVSKRPASTLNINEWRSNIKEIKSTFQKLKIWDCQRSVSQEEIFHYCLLLNVVGYSFDPINRPIQKNYSQYWPPEEQHVEQIRETKKDLISEKRKREKQQQW